ncbi:MAG: hypothetical protein AB1938_21205 [Myxococcota bacterium]
MRAVVILCLLSMSAWGAEDESEHLFAEAQTWTVAPITTPGWLLGGSGRASVGRFGLSVSGYQQALSGPAGTSPRLGSLLASMTATFRLDARIALGVSLGANTLFFEPDLASIAPSFGFFSRFDFHPNLSVQILMDAAPFPHYRIDALTEATLHWRALFVSLGLRIIHLEAPSRLGVPRGDVTTIGLQLAVGVDWKR